MGAAARGVGPPPTKNSIEPKFSVGGRAMTASDMMLLVGGDSAAQIVRAFRECEVVRYWSIRSIRDRIAVLG